MDWHVKVNTDFCGARISSRTAAKAKWKRRKDKSSDQQCGAFIDWDHVKVPPVQNIDKKNEALIMCLITTTRLLYCKKLKKVIKNSNKAINKSDVAFKRCPDAGSTLITNNWWWHFCRTQLMIVSEVIRWILNKLF